MTVPAPYSLPTASGWTLYDWRELQATSTAAASGTASLTFDQVPDSELWLIDRMVSYCDSTTDTRVRVYRSQTDPRSLRDGSNSGNFDVTEYPQGLLLRAGGQLLAQWTGASDGARGTLTVQLRVFRQA